MPAFDPVRDAVLNSPVTSSLALPQSARMHPDAANAKSPHLGASSHPRHPHSSAPGSGMSIVTSTSPSSATTSPSDSSPGAALVSPLTRRATDLSMLLNDPGPMDTPLFTPTTPRAPTGLTHLLLHDSDDGGDVEQLSQFTPMRRRSSATMSETSAGTPRETREISYFTHPGSINARPSSSSASHGASLQRESFGLALPGAAGAPPPTLASTSLAFPSSSGSRPSTAVSMASGPPASRPSTAGQPHSSSSSAASASMPPPPQAPQRSPLISTSSPSAVVAARAPPPQRATRPPSPSKTVPSPISVLSTAPTPPAPVPASAPAPPPVTASAPNTSSGPATAQKPPPPPRHNSSSGNGVSAKPLSSNQQKPQTSLPPPSASLPPKPEPPPSPPPSQMKRSTIPYAPRRITPAGSVLIPLSPAEMEKYRNYSGGVGTMILRKKKRVENLLGDGPVKRELEDPEAEENPRKKRRSGDVAVVVEHYNARPDVGVAQRQESPIIGLKSFNNWVKSVLITRFAHPVLAASPGQWRGRMRGRVLDMGCGKGGDLTKWAKANVAEYVGLDIAAVSVDQARQRHAGSRGARFTAEFFALDCYTHVLSDALPPHLLSTPFDVVSLQFCMHYAFESEAKARTMLRNVATWLRPSGMFIGTIPDAQQLMDHLDLLPEDAKELSWGNSVYKIRFEDRHNRPMFGHRYWFYLQDAVDDVPEYVVHWDNFVRMASEYGLELVYKKEFHQIFEEHSELPEFAPLLQRMHVVDSNGESQMDEDQWEAANVYVGFAFEKR
ncbi:mRNA capping enzyme-domain-containing protein [Cerioporus squamosus]|nr:mRNA capping enzyme-domain-containing protein [Cerioporus squamosus]